MAGRNLCKKKQKTKPKQNKTPNKKSVQSVQIYRKAFVWRIGKIRNGVPFDPASKCAVQ